MQIPRNKFAYKLRNIIYGPRSNNYRLVVGIWVIVCFRQPSHHFLQTLRPLRMFKIVFRDSSLYPKQLFLLSAKAGQRMR